MKKTFNAGLRLFSLFLKMLLTIYMAKYLSLYELGTYGLITAIVVVSLPLIGFRLEHIVSRDLVDESDFNVAYKLKNQFQFYGANYLLLSLILVIFYPLYSGYVDFDILLYVIALCILEGISSVTSSNITALGRPIVSNIVFFIRSASWVLPVIVLGLFSSEFQNVNFILNAWCVGAALSLVISVYIWRHLPWREAFGKKIDVKELKTDLKIALPLWIGGICVSMSNMSDRFILELFVDREAVGIISFFGSFTLAIYFLLMSGVFAFTYPKMISHFKQKRYRDLISLTKRVSLQATGISALLCIICSLVLPYFLIFIDKPGLSENIMVFNLMLVGIWIMTSSHGLEYLFYSQKRDALIWQGNILFFVVKLLSAIGFIHYFGIVGAGYSAIFSSGCLAIWRLYFYIKAPILRPSRKEEKVTA